MLLGWRQGVGIDVATRIAGILVAAIAVTTVHEGLGLPFPALGR